MYKKRHDKDQYNKYQKEQKEQKENEKSMKTTKDEVGKYRTNTTNKGYYNIL